MDLVGATGRFADDLLHLNHSRDPTRTPAELTAAYVTLANVKRTLDVTQRFWIKQSAARVQLFVDEAECRAQFPKHLFRKSSERRECEGRALDHFHTMHAAVSKSLSEREKRHAQATTFAGLKGTDHDAVHDLLRVSKATLSGDRELLELYLIRQNPNLLAIAMIDEGKLRSALKQLDRRAVVALLTGLNRVLVKGNSMVLRTTSQLISMLLKRITVVKALLYDGLRNVAAIRKALGNVDMDAGMRAVFGGLVEARFSTLFGGRGQHGGSIASVAGSVLSILLAVPVAPLAILTIVMGVTAMAAKVSLAAGVALYTGQKSDALGTYMSDYRWMRNKAEALPGSVMGNDLAKPSKMLIRTMFSTFDLLVHTAQSAATAPQALANGALDASERVGAAMAQGALDAAWNDLQRRAMKPQDTAEELASYIDGMSRVVMTPAAGEEAAKRMVDFFEGAMRGAVVRTGHHAKGYAGTILGYANPFAIDRWITLLVQDRYPWSSRRESISDTSPDESTDVFHDAKEFQDGGRPSTKIVKRGRR
ncbi:hypothetical protein CVIRNUC_003637 [Coccomyxa viridis]|uniref:Uncharacterized protein n=1 Tax=Coccomyxa viridis TaxID=1274662 RepID=A0AAV1I2G1_9CHLO|nr:hypothetical protein CVIRNUC_003637 [Coccomyxa viridis]